MDGYFFPKDPAELYAAGAQAHVPLLAGSDSKERGYAAVLGREKPTVENYRQALRRLYPGKAGEVFKLDPAANETEVMDAAQDLAGDRFISHSTWNWIEDAMANLDCNKVYAWTPDDYQVSKVLQESFFNGLDAQHTAQGVTINNLRLNGKPANHAADANLSVGQYVSDVRFGQAGK